ncbi:MAG: enoyl-CoA hydratase/isomerase family protein [Chloroflexota bacterium]
MAYEYVLYRLEGELALITLNRPRARNALNRQMVEDLNAALDTAEAEDTVKVIVLTGAGGKAFCAGADLQELQARTTLSELGPAAQARRRVPDRLENGPKPTIAAVNGWALGAGCELACACTLRLADETARFGLPELNLGIIPGLGGTQRLARLIGKGRAMHMLLTGEHIDAMAAYSVGLVSRVVPAAELLDAARALGRCVAAKAPLALRAAKDAVNLGYEMDLTAALELENRLAALCHGSADKNEGIAAFLEKRAPRWQSR